MKAGDFYASNGIALKDINFDDKTFKIEIGQEPVLSYTILFVGTKKDFDICTKEVTFRDGDKGCTEKVTAIRSALCSKK